MNISYFFSPLLLFCIVFSHSLAFANEIEKKFVEAGLLDVHTVDPSIGVDLVNSDPSKNFFKENFYRGLSKAYLRKEVATKLSQAQSFLVARHPGYSLLIMDAARPRSVSQLMYDKMKGTRFEKFVANPQKGSMHNYGIAVDITITDSDGEEIDMGFSPFYRDATSIYLGYARLKLLGITDRQKENRQLLATVMENAGFFPLSYEWWHFNGLRKSEARERYAIIE